MTIAEMVRDCILTRCPNTFSLCAGYGMEAGQYVRFAGGLPVAETRNDKGRCTRAVYRYADNSTLEYRYSAARETYKLIAKEN